METVVPEDLTALTVEELNELKAALDAEFDRNYDDGADVATLTDIADQIDVVRARVEHKTAEVAAEAEQRAALHDRVHAESDPDDEDADADTDAEAAPDAGEASQDETPTDEASAEIEITENNQEHSVEDRELVTASAKPSARNISARSPRPEAPAAEEKHSLVITAAADVPGYSTGATLDKKHLAYAMHSKSRGLSDRSQRVPVGTIKTPVPEHLIIHDNSDVDSILASATRTTTAEALIAAGGWCTPSMTMYEMFGLESRDGLFDLPTVGISRGGLKVPSYINMSEAAGALWTWTETDDEDAADPEYGGAGKPCLRIPCPTFTDYRLEAEGLCLTHGNLMDRSFPEMTERFIDVTITSHLHRLSAAALAKVVAANTNVGAITATGSDGAGDLLSALDLQVADYRSQHFLPLAAVLEVVLPTWVREAIRSTLAMRQGVALTNVTNAEIDGHFATRNVRPQYVQTWDPLYSAAASTAWPTSVDVVMYASGAFVYGDGGAIDLGVVRDSTLNALNDFTAAWTEQFYTVIQRGPAGRNFSVQFNIDGVTGCCPREAVS